jgi:hypothetical protein
MGLTADERRLLTYPPTQKTWLCRGKYTVTKIVDGLPSIVTLKCSMTNNGANRRCVICGTKKSATPKLLWPLYELACKKAGIEPGTRWPPKAEPDAEAIPPKRKTKRKGA